MTQQPNERQCLRKKIYWSVSAAADAGQHAIDKRGTPLRVYKCPNCPGYHLTARVRSKPAEVKHGCSKQAFDSAGAARDVVTALLAAAEPTGRGVLRSMVKRGRWNDVVYHCARCGLWHLSKLVDRKKNAPVKAPAPAVLVELPEAGT